MAVIHVLDKHTAELIESTGKGGKIRWQKFEFWTNTRLN